MGLGTTSTTGTQQERIRLLRSQRIDRQPRAWARLNVKVHLLLKATPSRLEEVAVCLMHRNKHRESTNMKQKRNMISTERTR